MIIIILFISLGLRLVNLNQSLWLDEAAQAIESARPLFQQFNIEGDFQPPLFHLLLHFWMYLGHSEFGMRLLPVFFGVGTVYMTYLTAREFFGYKGALLAAFLLAVSPYHIYYSQELRPYSLSAFTGITVTYFLLKRQFIEYAVLLVLFLYSVYLSPLLIAMHGIYIYLFDKANRKQWFYAVLVGLIFFTPWLPAFLKQLKIGTDLTRTLPGWSGAVSPQSLTSLPIVFSKFVLGRITVDNKLTYGLLVFGLFCGYLYLAYLCYVHKRRQSVPLSLFLVGPILAAFIISWVIPVLAPQRVIFSLPFFYIIPVLGMTTLKKQLRFIPPLIFTCLSCISLYLYFTQPKFQREQWRESVKFVEETRSAFSVAVFAFPEPFAPWQWYSKGVVPVLSVAPGLTVTPEDINRLAADISKYDKIFFYHYLTDLTDPQRRIAGFMHSAGFFEIKTQDFPGAGFVTVYEKALALY